MHSFLLLSEQVGFPCPGHSSALCSSPKKPKGASTSPQHPSLSTEWQSPHIVSGLVPGITPQASMGLASKLRCPCFTRTCLQRGLTSTLGSNRVLKLEFKS